MKLFILHEAKTSKATGKDWELGVKPSIHYLQKSSNPLQMWQAKDLVMAFVGEAKAMAKYVIKKHNLSVDDTDDLVQTGLLKAFEKIQSLQHGRPITGKQLIQYIHHAMYDWMIQGGGKGEDWRSTTSQDLRADKARRPGRPSSIVRQPPQAAGLMRGLEDMRVELLDTDAKEELAYAVDGITKERTRDIMRRFLGVVGQPPIRAQDLATEFGISYQAIGNHIKKGMAELKSNLTEVE